MGKMKDLKIKLEDDWGELTDALEKMEKGADDLALATGALPEWFDTIAYYVPKLMAAFDDLYLLSEGLLKAVESQKTNETPEGLYVPPGALVAPSVGKASCA